MPPISRFSYSYRYPSYYSYSNFSKIQQHNADNIKNEDDMATKDNQKENRYTYNKNIPIFPVFFDMDGFSNIEKPVLDILGIKLYQDDLIIFALLFILYKENVKDEMLFICLILLLIS